MWHIFLLTLPAYLKRNAYERNVPKPDNPLLAHHQLDHGILSTPQVVQSVPLPIPLEIGLQLMYIARPTGSEQTLFPTWNGLRKYSVRQKREKHQLHITTTNEGHISLIWMMTEKTPKKHKQPMIYLPFIFGVLKKFRSFVEITKLRKQRNDRLKDILHNLLAYYQTWLNLENLQMESTIISQSLFCILHRRTWTAFSYSDSKVFPEPNQTNEKNIRTCPFFIPMQYIGIPSA